LPLIGPVALSALLALSLFTGGGRRVLPSVFELVAVLVVFLVLRRGATVSWGLLAGFTCYWLGAALGWTH
jgi:hypothetical protein